MLICLQLSPAAIVLQQLSRCRDHMASGKYLLSGTPKKKLGEPLLSGDPVLSLSFIEQSHADDIHCVSIPDVSSEMRISYPTN